jgi:hypothetical protein
MRTPISSMFNNAFLSLHRSRLGFWEVFFDACERRRAQQEINPAGAPYI